MSDVITVWLEEEWGYRYWRWDTGMTHEELVSFWKGMETVAPYFFSLHGLPGTLTSLDQDEWDRATRTILGETPEDFRVEDWIPEASSDDREVRAWAKKLAHILASPLRLDIYKAHIHEDEDSVLKLPGEDEPLVYHKGFKRYED